MLFCVTTLNRRQLFGARRRPIFRFTAPDFISSCPMALLDLESGAGWHPAHAEREIAIDSLWRGYRHGGRLTGARPLAGRDPNMTPR